MTDWTPATHDRAKLTITSIDIMRAPGITPGFRIDTLSPDITIVFGPNASGKSTTARAIQAILWPHTSTLRGHQLRATFTLNGDSWEVSADAGRVSRTRNGENAPALPMAPIDDRARYTLGLPDLLASENQPLAQAILNESSGGFDIGQAARDLGFEASIPPRLEAARTMQAALNSLQQIAATDAENANTLSERGSLLARRVEAIAAADDVAAIDSALQLRAREAEEAELRVVIEAFPANVQRFTGSEPEAIAEVTRRIELASQQLGDARRQRDRWQSVVDKAALDEVENPEAIRSRIATLEQQRVQLAITTQTNERELATAVAERKSHQTRLAQDIDDEQIAALDTRGMRELADISASFESIRARRSARDEVELWLGGVKAPENLDSLKSGVDVLQARLQHPNAAERREQIGNLQIASLIGGVLTAVGGAALGIAVNPLWWFLAAAGVLLIIFAWRLGISDSPRIASELESQYGSLTLPQPAQWRMSDVRDLLGQLNDELKVAMVEQEKADRWTELEQERQELEQALADTEARRLNAVSAFGVAPDLREESLRLIAENLGRWQAADAVVRGKEGIIAKLTNDEATLERQLQESLASVGYADGDSATHIADLDRRLESWKSATAERDTMQRAIDEGLQPQVNDLTAARDAIYTELDLEPNDARGLEDLRGRRERLQAARAQLQHREAATAEAFDALSLTPQWRSKTVAELNEARHQATTVAATRSDIEQQLRDLAHMERAAMRRHLREDATSDLADARADLMQARDAVAEAAIGDALARGIQAQTRDAALPLVFHRARQLFGIITRGKYELQFEQGPPPEFTALDTATGATLHLEQLSSGTRVQLLMAIRLAFVETVEVGPKLPVLLDETLGNSDEFRASAIVDAAIDICRNGRQVFYFTAQGEEVARWLHRVEEMPEADRPNIRVIELAEVRRDAGFDRLPLPQAASTQRSQVPSPRDYDAETWRAALRVPAIDPWADSTGGVHLWHVSRDTEVLYGLLQEDVSTIGQFESLMRTSPDHVAMMHEQANEAIESVRAKTTLLDAAISMWRIGRARPMPAGVLADADMIDAVALDEMSALQAAADNDGQALLDTLNEMDDPPLAEKPLEALELWLISEGYRSQGQQMSASDIRARLIEIASPAIRTGVLGSDDVEDVLTTMESW